MAKPGTNRTLEVLTGELNSALMRKTADKIALGGLFAEAKKEVGHGHWLKYLKENFSLSDNHRRELHQDLSGDPPNYRISVI